LSIQKLIAIFLAPLLVLTAQQNQLTPQSAGGLKIVVMQGEGAKNQIRNRTAIPPAVEVRDADDKPVAGAEVVFQLPAVGPSGVFNGWLTNQTIRTDEKGVATVTGYTPNGEAGRFNIKVSATAGSKTGSAVIAQSNVENGSSASSSNRKWWIVLGVAGAAAAGGIAAAASGSSSTAATAAKVPISISSGAITVGAPR
jgi:hypothetical protein